MQLDAIKLVKDVYCSQRGSYKMSTVSNDSAKPTTGRDLGYVNVEHFGGEKRERDDSAGKIPERRQ